MIKHLTTFRPLEISQIETITKMMQKFYAIDHYPIDIEVSKKLFREFISNENLGKSWLIYSDETIVGYVILTFIFSFEYQGKIAFLDELYLNENARGKGIGRETIRFIKKQAVDSYVKKLYLEVENHNQNARKMYLVTGFEVHNRKIMTYSL